MIDYDDLESLREHYRAYCPKCNSVLSMAEYHRSNDDYLGVCLECDEDFYAFECKLERETMLNQYSNENPPWKDNKWQYGQYNHIMQRFKALGFVPPSEKNTNTDKRG